MKFYLSKAKNAHPINKNNDFICSFIIYLQESNLGWLRDKLNNVDFNNMIFPLNSVIIQHLDRLSM